MDRQTKEMTRVIENKTGLQPKKPVNSFWFHCPARSSPFHSNLLSVFFQACMEADTSFYDTIDLNARESDFYRKYGFPKTIADFPERKDYDP